MLSSDLSGSELPLITVITVVLNGEQFLEETIRSVIAQTYPRIEYIIIDGGSTDGTLDIIRKYEKEIDYWVSEKDAGIYDAMNKGICKASGHWINFMNSGDTFYSPNTIFDIFSKKIADNVDIIFGSHEVVYPSGQKKIVTAGKPKNLWKGSQFCHQACFIRTEYQKLHRYSSSVGTVADFDLFYRAWRAGVVFQETSLVIASYRAGGISDTNRIKSILGWKKIVRKSVKVEIYYCFLIAKEIIKRVLKRLIFLSPR